MLPAISSTLKPSKLRGIDKDQPMSKSILFVDENDSIITTMPKSLQTQYRLLFASSYKEALTLLKTNDDCRLLITELGLNNKNGIKFLTHVRKNYPQTVRVVLTAQNDCSKACEALNKARIFQFLKKPCPPDILKKHIGEALLYFAKSKEKQQAMRKTLLGSVQAMVDILDLVNPEAMGLSKRIKDRVLRTGKTLGYKPLWQLELAVLLSHIGCVALPSEIVTKMDQGEKLLPEEWQIYCMHPSIASNLLANIDQMAPVAEIIQHELSPLMPDQPLGSRIIKIALDLDRQERKGRDSLTILDKMSTKAKIYDPKIVKIMLKQLKQPDALPVRQLNVEDLQEGMVIAKNLTNKDGVILLLRGQTISKASLIRLKSFHIALGILDPIHVMTASKAPV